MASSVSVVGRRGAMRTLRVAVSLTAFVLLLMVARRLGATATTIVVDLEESVTVSSSSMEFNLSDRITVPGTWASDQYIAVEISITSTDSDTAPTYRGPGGCIVDIKDNRNSSSTLEYGYTANNASQTLTGVTGSVFIINDRTPQLSLYGQASSVSAAVANVRISCSTLADLAGKFVRFGAVPTEAPESIDGSTANGGLFYLFSTNHYYEFAKDSTASISTSHVRIGEMMNVARSRSISVNGRTIGLDAGSRPRGWIATATTRDEVLLTTAIGNMSNSPMFGVTDVGSDSSDQGSYLISAGNYRTQSNGRDWTWDSDAWGEAPSGTGACTTREGDYRWLGPDAWCQRLPARNNFDATTKANTRYWLRDSSNGQWSQGSSDSFTIDMGSTDVDPDSSDFNGFGSWHGWAMDGSNNLIEPNTSGDYIYWWSGFGWDDAGPADGVERDTTRLQTATRRYMFIEYCSGRSEVNTCTPHEDSVDQINLRRDQTLTFTNPGNQVGDFTVSATASSGLDVDFSSSTPGVCTVEDDVVTKVSEGLCTLVARQPGNATWNAADDVTRSFGMAADFRVEIDNGLTQQVATSASTYNLGPVSLVNAPPRVIIHIQLTDAAGTPVAATDTFQLDVGTSGLQDTEFGAGSNRVSIDGDRSTEIVLEGTRESVEDLLEQLRIFRSDGSALGADAANRRVRVQGIASEEGLVWSPQMQHYYRLATRSTSDGLGSVNDCSDDPCVERHFLRWTTARHDARQSSITINGVTYRGYLAAVTTRDEFLFLNDKVSGGGGSVRPAWVGGSDFHTEGTWRWVEGPEAAASGGDLPLDADGDGIVTNAERNDTSRYLGRMFFGPVGSAPSAGTVADTNSRNLCTDRGSRGICTLDGRSHYVRWSPGGTNFSRDWDGTGLEVVGATEGDGVFSPQPDNYSGSNNHVDGNPGEDALIINWCAGNRGAIGNAGVSPIDLYGDGGEFYCTPGWNDLPHNWINNAHRPDSQLTSFPSGQTSGTLSGFASTPTADSGYGALSSQFIVEYCGYEDQPSCSPPANAVKNVSFDMTDDSTSLSWSVANRASRASASGGTSCTSGTHTETSLSTHRIVRFSAPASGTGQCTWTPPIGVTHIEVLLVGGGGGLSGVWVPHGCTGHHDAARHQRKPRIAEVAGARSTGNVRVGLEQGCNHGKDRTCLEDVDVVDDETRQHPRLERTQGDPGQRGHIGQPGTGGLVEHRPVPAAVALEGERGVRRRARRTASPAVHMRSWSAPPAPRQGGLPRRSRGHPCRRNSR